MKVQTANAIAAACLLTMGALTGASFVVAADRHDASHQWETDAPFPVDMREPDEAVLRWNVHGCTDGQDCLRFEHWARSRFYFGSDAGTPGTVTLTCATDMECETLVQQQCEDEELTEVQCEALRSANYL